MLSVGTQKHPSVTTSGAPSQGLGDPRSTGTLQGTLYAPCRYHRVSHPGSLGLSWPSGRWPKGYIPSGSKPYGFTTLHLLPDPEDILVWDPLRTHPGAPQAHVAMVQPSLQGMGMYMSPGAHLLTTCAEEVLWRWWSNRWFGVSHGGYPPHTLLRWSLHSSWYPPHLRRPSGWAHMPIIPLKGYPEEVLQMVW